MSNKLPPIEHRWVEHLIDNLEHQMARHGISDEVRKEIFKQALLTASRQMKQMKQGK